MHPTRHEPGLSIRSSVRLLNTTRQTATKNHQCVVCGFTIYKGETYDRYVYKDLEAIGNTFRCSRIHKRRCPTTESAHD